MVFLVASCVDSAYMIESAACDDKIIDRDDLVEREGVLYEKFATQPFSGLVKGNVSGVVKDGTFI